MQAWGIVYAIAAAQAALLALALWRRAANVAANHVLSAWTALVAVDLGDGDQEKNERHDQQPGERQVPAPSRRKIVG